MEYTKNLKLSKPSYDDDVDIQVLNNNMDILDDRIAGVRNYLPLTGGTMSGNITLPFNIGLNYDTNHWLNFQTTNFKGVSDTTLAMKGDRFKYYSPSGKEFVVEDSGAYWNEKRLLTEDDKGVFDVIKESKLSWGTGYTKLNNGLLLQWGYFTPKNTQAGSSGEDQTNEYTVTLPLPFADDGYVVQVNRSNASYTSLQDSSGYQSNLTAGFTTTQFKVNALTYKYNRAIHWFAIGKGVL